MEKPAPIHSSQTKLYQVATGPFFDKYLTYKSNLDLEQGSLVTVPISGTAKLGMVIKESSQSAEEISKQALKEVLSLRPGGAFSDEDLELFSWVCRYYAGTFEQTLQCMTPAQTSTKRTTIASLTAKGLELLASQKTLFADTVDKEASDLKAELTSLGFGEGNLEPLSISASRMKPAKQLLDKDVLRFRKEKEIVFRKSKEQQEAKTSKQAAVRSNIELSAEQSAVFEELIQKQQSGFGVDLLHGITGSGKTEVYLRYIETFLQKDPDAQALLLIPEISLTPQTAARIEHVFPDIVAITHSQMTDLQRFKAFDSIANGQKKILVGPRSNVFARFANLKMILVDEEHDSSYKQSTGLCYHARDVAIKRAQILKIHVLLGSATPSLETMQNCNTGKCTYHSLPNRHKKTPLPCIEVHKIEPTFKFFRNAFTDAQPRTQPISEQSLAQMDAVLARKKQVMIVQGRRGTSQYVYNKKSSEVLRCSSCEVTYTLHKNGRLLCHYCGKQENLKTFANAAGHQEFFAIGTGTQSLEEFLQSRFEGHTVKRLDSDITRKKGLLEETLAAFRDGKIDILIGTQMLAKGHDFPGIDLVILVDLDQSLLFPDFRASETTTQTIIQAAGRSGRGSVQGQVVIESSNPAHWAFDYIQNHDYLGFSKRELESRALLRYPPYSRATLLEIQSKTLLTGPQRNQLLAPIKDVLESEQNLRVLGPCVPMLSKVGNMHRLQVLFLSPLGERRSWLPELRRQCKPLSGTRLKWVVDPGSLL